MTTRRHVLGWATLVPLAVFCRPCPASARNETLRPLWQAWKDVHMTPQGRVVDRWQDYASHSEGQAYGLLLAEAFGDRDSFERILDWSNRHLAIRPEDPLRAWKWAPENGAQGDAPGAVTDMNNATDGDLFHAWALLRAGRSFDAPDWTRLAGYIGAAISEKCLRPDPASHGALVMLPGAEGFEANDGSLVLNPSYWCPRAMIAVGRETGNERLLAAGADAVALLASLTRSSLPPDWIALSAAGFTSAPNKSEDYGYEALRLVLYLVWSGLSGHPAVLRAAAAYRPFLEANRPETPTVIARQGGDILETSPDPGYRALASLAACSAPGATAMPPFVPGQPYYPATLHLLSLIAQREASFACYTA